MSYALINGPFQGVTPQASELSVTTRDDGTKDTYWGVHDRTRVVLDMFKPADGWSIQVNVTDPGISMEDNYTRSSGAEAVIQPTREFIATLTSPAGHVIASASVLKIINSEFAWKGGITAARGALYEALGLPGSSDAATESDDSGTRKPRTSNVREVPMPEPEVASRQATATDDDDLGDDLGVIPIGTSESTYVEDAGGEEDADTALQASDSETIGSTDEAPVATPEAPEAQAMGSEGDNDGASETAAEATAEATTPSVPATATPARPRSQQASAEDREVKAKRAKEVVSANGVPKGLSNRIAKLYREAGKPVPSYSTVDEATQLLTQIMDGSAGSGIGIQGSL